MQLQYTGRENSNTNSTDARLIRDKNESDEGKMRVNDICRGHGE